MKHRRAGLLAALIGAAAALPVRAQPFSVFRYDDDATAFADPAMRVSLYDHLKYIPLGDAPGDYLSFGGDLRERVEAVGNALLGARDKGDNAYDLHRLLLFADLHYDWARAFMQFGNHVETGRAPAAIPTDIDRGDLQQGFLDLSVSVAAGALILRGGRAEMSFDEGALIGLRDGPNVRQVWDGLRAFYVQPDARIDAFLVKPVNVGPGYLDDRALRGQTLWGVHADWRPAFLAPVQLNAFYYGNTMPHVSFASGAGAEETHTLGLRLRAAGGAVDGSVGAIGQTGTFSHRSVLAWAAHGDVGWTMKLPWSPRIGLRGDVLSGGGARGTEHTFNALYPNVAYSTEATIEAPANLIQPGVTLRATPFRAVTVQYTFEGLWRYSTRDAFYAAPLFPLVRPDGSNRRFSGTEQQIEAAWQIDDFVSLTAAYVHFEAGAFIRAANASHEDFGMTELSVRF